MITIYCNFRLCPRGENGIAPVVGPCPHCTAGQEGLRRGDLICACLFAYKPTSPVDPVSDKDREISELRRERDNYAQRVADLAAMIIRIGVVARTGVDMVAPNVIVGSDPECVCGDVARPHLKSEHDATGRCTISSCACGPGCIHDGFVDRQERSWDRSNSA